MTNRQIIDPLPHWSTEGLTTLPALLEKAVQKWPDRTLLDFEGDKHTYIEFDRASNRMARGLAELGVGKGECVCVMLDNSVDMTVIWFATVKLGAIFVPFNTTYKGAYLQHQIRDTAGRIMVAEAHYLDVIRDVFDDSLSLETLVCRGSLPEEAMPVRLIKLEEVPVADESPIVCDIKPLEPAVIHYTSGTTGPSKGGVLCQNFFCDYSQRVAWTTDLGPDDVIWTPCPMFHGSALLMILAAMHVGATASIYSHFSVTHFWPEIERSGATVALLLSIMVTLVADAPDSEAAKRCHGQIRTLMAIPLSPAVKARWQQRFGVKYAFSTSYGSTEISSVTIAHCTDENMPHTASGKRFPHFDVRVVDDNGDECPPNVPGEIIVRPNRPGVMFSGYWRRPEATLAVFRDLWYWSGDIGMFDENDYFYFVDRKKDYLRKGGENISSFEVEETFMAHPAVSEVAAHAVPSELAEDDLKVTIICAEGANITEPELHAWSVERLPKFAVPRYIEFRDKLPRTANGRLQKNILREQGITPNTWDSKPYDKTLRDSKQS